MSNTKLVLEKITSCFLYQIDCTFLTIDQHIITDGQLSDTVVWTLYKTIVLPVHRNKQMKKTPFVKRHAFRAPGIWCALADARFRVVFSPFSFWLPQHRIETTSKDYPNSPVVWDPTPYVIIRMVTQSARIIV